MDVKDKVVIVTGASSGIGLSTAELLAKKGAKVALVSRSQKKLSELSKNLSGSIVVVADMSKPEDVRKMVEKVHKHFGRIDILVNNAGQGYDAAIENITIDTFHYIFYLDVVGPLVAMKQIIPIMRKQGGGSIVNISSGTALMALPGMGGYSSLKRALVGLSLTAREELKDDNISVSIIYPYMTATDFEKNTIREGSEDMHGNGEGGGPPFPLDSAEHVAKIILEAIKIGEAEIYAHDWMKNRR